MPVAVFGTGCVLGLESFSTSALANMVRAFLTLFRSPAEGSHPPLAVLPDPARAALLLREREA